MREWPSGGPAAHGFFTLSLIPALSAETLALEQRMDMNYGLNHARFVSRALVGSQWRARFAVEAVVDIDNVGVQVQWTVLLEKQGGDCPVCVAEFITRHYI